MLRNDNDLPVGETPDIYDIGTAEGAPRTTKKLALAARESKDLPGYYRNIEWPVAHAFGAVLSLLMGYNMPNHYESETPKAGFSVLSCQLNQAYEQLRCGTGPVEQQFQKLFRGKFGRNACSFADFSNLASRRQDIQFIIGVVRKFCPWPEVADNFEHYVNRTENLLLESFQVFFRRDFLPRMEGRVLLPGPQYKKKDRTNMGRLEIELDGAKVKFTFWPRWKLRPGHILFAGDTGDRSGAYVISKCTLPAWQAHQILDSFLWRTEGNVATLDAYHRALKRQGFVIVKDPRSHDPVLADKALIAA